MVDFLCVYTDAFRHCVDCAKPIVLGARINRQYLDAIEAMEMIVQSFDISVPVCCAQA